MYYLTKHFKLKKPIKTRTFFYKNKLFFLSFFCFGVLLMVTALIMSSGGWWGEMAGENVNVFWKLPPLQKILSMIKRSIWVLKWQIPIDMVLISLPTN